MLNGEERDLRVVRGQWECFSIREIFIPSPLRPIFQNGLANAHLSLLKPFGITLQKKNGFIDNFFIDGFKNRQ
jgi:hypothetical protein